MPLYIGLISGTSMDAVDAALMSFEGCSMELLGFCSTPYPSDLRRQLQGTAAPEANYTAAQLGALDTAVGEAFANAAIQVLERTDTRPQSVQAIGSHGQTILHRPDARPPFTLQVGDPNIIAARTGITTVAGFRGMDLACGGQGAPLAPIFHAAWLRAPASDRAILNLGGIANLTILWADAARPVIGFDTGPANALLDEWATRHLDQPFDLNGEWARGGQVNDALLDRLLADPYFEAPVPKSTGRDYFNLFWLEATCRNLIEACDPRDVQATLLALTARSVARAVQREAPGARELLVCGGGARNAALMDALAAALPGCRVTTTEAAGIAPEMVEAAAFAYLAKLRLEGRPGNVPSVTGAHRTAVLGGIYAPPPT